MSAIVLHVGEAASLPIRLREAARYLGLRGELSPENEALLAAVEGEVRAVAVPKAVVAESPAEVCGETVRFSFCTVESAALAQNLAGCKRALVFAATLGLGVDRALLRLQKTDPAKAAVFDALSSAAVEGWCNQLNETLSRGLRTRPRFSPGYGGVALSHQRDVLSFLDAQRKLGITLSERYFMTPVKSVTAFVGVEE